MTKNKQVPDTQALNELTKIGKPAVLPTVKRLKTEKDSWKQQYYLILLYDIGDETISDEIVPCTKSNNGDVREWAIFVLGKIGNEGSIGVLIDSLSDSVVEDQAKAQAVERLQELTGEDIRFKENMTFQEKEASMEAWRKWWEENKESFGKER